MALDDLNSAPTVAPPSDKTRIFNDVVAGSWRTSKRSKRQRLSRSEDEYLAACLVMLARSGGGPYPSSSADKTSDGTYKKPKKLKDPVFPTMAESYWCYICDKTIASYHELAGHRASHRTDPATAPVFPSDSENEGPYAVIPDWIPPVKPSGGRLHKCLICHKSFTSGEALVGHKREHYEGVIGNANDTAPKPQTTSSNGGDRVPVSAAVVRDFDLNMPPPTELLCDEASESALPP